MTVDLLARAQAGDGDAFGQLVDPYRRELQVHCYRLLGSVADAEDALQDTLLSAWQGLAGFEGRASVRTWLYRVATNRCLDALRSARRRPPVSAPPAGLEPPEPTRLGELLWLEPYPDTLLEGLPIADPVRKPGTSPGNRSRSPSSPPCSCCRHASGRPSSCAMCSDSTPARPPASWTPVRSRLPARSSAPAQHWSATSNRQDSENLPRRLTLPPNSSW